MSLFLLIMLFFCTIVLGCAFLLPKNEKLSASAESSSPFTKTELDGLATTAGYDNFGTMSYALSKGTTLNASQLGTTSISFGGMDWWPVLAKSSGNDVILTLWLKTSIGNYTWSDGTYSTSGTASPVSNNYQYSWIRAAINAGQTSEGYYYGTWSNGSGTTSTKYANNLKSASANCAPTAFTAFSSIVGNSYIIKGGDYGDYLWLPSTGEAASGGSWGCTSTQWTGTAVWTRSPDLSYYEAASGLNMSGGTGYTRVDGTYGVRPAINVKISGATVSAPTADETPVTYTGKTIPFPLTYDQTYVDVTSITATDPNGNTIPDVNEANIYNNSFNVTLAGTYKITLELKSTAVTDGMQWCDEKGGTSTKTITFTINKADPKITFDTNSSYYTTLGFPEPEINTTGSLDWGVQEPEAGTKEYSYTFTPDDTDNYNIVRDTVTLKYYEPEIDHIDVKFDSGGVDVYDLTPEQTYMKMFTVTVYYDDGGEPQVTTNFSVLNWVAGTNVQVTIKLPSGDTEKCIVSEIKKSVVNDIDVYFTQGSAVIYPYTPLDDLKDMLLVDAYWSHSSKAIEVDPADYELSGDLLVGGSEITVTLKDTGISKTFTNITVSKGIYELPDIDTNISLGNGEAYDPNDWLGELPEGLTVKFFYENGDEFDNVSEPGTYKVIAKFSGDSDNYVMPSDITFTLSIDDNFAIPKVESEKYYDPSGNDFTPAGFENIAELVELYENGALVTADEAFVKTEIDTYEIFVKFKADAQATFTDGSSEVTLTFSIVKCVVDIPVFKDGSLVFNGKTITAAAENFEYNADAVAFVRADGGINAGTTYYAVFKLIDTDHYEWANASTKSVVRYSLTDEELGEGEVQVPWTIAKAAVTATVADGKMPVFSCTTVGDLSGYITYTYYKDELCTEPVEFKNLQPDTRYYVKATFTDEDNFELDDSALGVLNGVSTYDTAAKEPSFIQKAMAFVKTNWLWFVIGAAALVFLIILICIIAAARRKNKEKREERKAEKKEEERQRRAEEREDRMMRMQMGGQMPITAAGMIAAQQMPAQQQMPMQQPMQTNGGSDNTQLIAELKAEVAELRARQGSGYAQPIVQQPVPVAAQPQGYMSSQYIEERVRALEERITRDAEERARADERARAADERVLRAAEERALRAELGAVRQPYYQQPVQYGGVAADGEMEKIVAVATAVWRNMQAQAQQPQQVQTIPAAQQSETPAAVYPPDAVVTTTTTVDTTKNKPIARSREEQNFDVDGFYDSFDGN